MDNLNNLAHSDKSIRDTAFTTLSKTLLSSPKMSTLEYLKLWKALFYSFWMSDKPLVQQEFAENICSLMHQLDTERALIYMETFWCTISRDWYGIDAIRLNKYFMFLRKFHGNTFKWLDQDGYTRLDSVLKMLGEGPLNEKTPFSLIYHTCECFLEEYWKLVDDGKIQVIPKTQFMLILNAFVDLFNQTENEKILKLLWEQVFECKRVSEVVGNESLADLLYPIPFAEGGRSKNKKILKEYLKVWSDQVGIPFIETRVVTGLKVEKIEVPVERALKRKAEDEGYEKVAKRKSDLVVTNEVTVLPPIKATSPKKSSPKKSSPKVKDGIVKGESSPKAAKVLKEQTSPKAAKVSKVQASPKGGLTPAKSLSKVVKDESPSKSPKKAKSSPAKVTKEAVETETAETTEPLNDNNTQLDPTPTISPAGPKPKPLSKSQKKSLSKKQKTKQLNLLTKNTIANATIPPLNSINVILFN